jgi:mannose-1-phosphate guanylyltransferase
MPGSNGATDRHVASGARPRALILTAGLGTRLRPLTDVRAKAAVPVNGEPLVRRVIRWLASHEIRDLVLNLHHHPASITARIGDGHDLAVRVRYSWEQPVLGSAGGPRHALPLLVDGEGQHFLLVNGDTLTNLDPRTVLQAHVISGALVTMALIPNPMPDKYGGVRVGDDGAITGFTRPGAPGRSYHFIGVQAATASAFAGLDEGVPVSSVGNLYDKLMQDQPGSVRAFICDAGFQDIGTPADCLATSLALSKTEGDRLTSASARIHSSAHVVRTALWDDVVVADHAHLTDCIVGDGVTIPPGARFERCAIVPAGNRAPEADERLEEGLLIRPF